MAFSVRNQPDELTYALVAAHNQTQIDNISTNAHLSRQERVVHQDFTTQSVTRVQVTAAAAVATTTSTLVNLSNDLKSVINEHVVSPYPVHNTAVDAVVTTATATDAATSITLANALKTAYNAHLTSSGVHFTNDSTNAISAAAATDAATLVTLLTEMKTDVNAHLSFAPAGTVIKIVPA